MIELRKANISDIDEIYRLNLQCFEPHDIVYRVTIQSFIDNTVVAVKNNIIIGCMAENNDIACSFNRNENKYNELDFKPLIDKGHIFKQNNYHTKQLYGIQLLFVKDKYRRMGVATMLLRHHLKKHSITNKYLYIFVRPKNNKAIELYTKMGYRKYALIFDRFELSDGIYDCTAIYMIYES